MALNSQLDASVFSAKNENTVAFLNAHADFALIKVEVPQQYEGLGKALSHHRRKNAECGQQHITARRLGALFEPIIPNIDILASKYGTRVSEIARSPQFEVKPGEYGPFEQYAGVDGTSIYAAVSSGNSTIALHLLACLLARMFSSAEATAIWVQLVESRLKEIEENSDPNQILGRAAIFSGELGRQILRDDLASWDASARAWLEAANHIKEREYIQLKLIIKNVPSIRSSDAPYRGIIQNWITTMETIQDIIQGKPRNITNGSILLGLMSWHIYPDLSVFSPNCYVKFDDSLVETGGVITLGLEQKDEDQTGVSWSVSLSHLRYYGDPIVIKKSSSEDSDRISVRELRFVTFGSLLANWGIPASTDISEVAECFIALGKALQLDESADDLDCHDSLSGIALLIDAARSFQSSVGIHRDFALHHIEFGRRRGRKFLDENRHGNVPMFGLSNPYLIFQLYTKWATENLDLEVYIALLRQLAKDCNFPRNSCIIASRPPCPIAVGVSELGASLDGSWELTTAIPVPTITGKRSRDGKLQIAERHIRWVHIDRTKDPLYQRYREISDNLDNIELDNIANIGETSIGLSSPDCDCHEKRHACDDRCSCRKLGFKCTSLCLCLSHFPGLDSSRCMNSRDCVSLSGATGEDFYWLSTRSTLDMNYYTQLVQPGSKFRWHDPPCAFVDKSNELVVSLDELQMQDELDYDDKSSYSSNALGQELTFRSIQSNGIAGLFIMDGLRVEIPKFSLSRLIEVFQSGTLDPLLLREYLKDIPYSGIMDYSLSLEGENHSCDTIFRSLTAVSAACELYDDLPGATISVGILKQPLGLSHWATNIWDCLPEEGEPKLWRSTKFSCLAMMESGVHNIHPDHLEPVMAMAAGNSIYASEALLQDPTLQDHSGLPVLKGIRRIIGNIGYPGVVMLIPPPSPQMLQVDPTRERFGGVETFDGIPQDCLTQTSLHLRCTEYKFPLASAPGAVDADVLIREALISVYDGSRWIADLDILKGFESPDLDIVSDCHCQREHDHKYPGQLLVQEFGVQLKAITTWDQLLLCNNNLIEGEIGAVSVYGNWFARLAVASLATRMGSQSVVFPSHCVCNSCGEVLLDLKPQYLEEQKNGNPVLFIF
ncbi:hypothetical protein F5Y00DRAFT_268206 [Daldinia vernicosa]|uniref:uncharacterized protein n=1 Tax=Daldinia vernicosa TaxID=114800 RepID=UPI0020076E74|nr:uncharacterized protein F5Y00DRAFT_268206 [Daldinia vernicosa]KAI0850815.1 hypothetical protein F5Y00DRAFT_268206 [Daldinia vernicosa]